MPLQRAIVSDGMVTTFFTQAFDCNLYSNIRPQFPPQFLPQSPNPQLLLPTYLLILVLVILHQKFVQFRAKLLTASVKNMPLYIHGVILM